MENTIMTRDEAITTLTAPGQPYEIAQIEVLGRKQRAFNAGPATLRELLENSRRFGEIKYLVFDGEQLSFDQTYAEVARVARLLVEDYGIQKGDRVAIAMRNYPEWITAFLAITSVGGIAVALNSMWNTEELLYALELTSPSLLVADGGRIEHLRGNLNDIDMPVLAVRCKAEPQAGIFDYHAIPASADGTENLTLPEVGLDPDDDCLIVFTSGSTGHPKGAVSSHRAVCSAIMSWGLETAIAFKTLGEEPPNEPFEFQAQFLLGVPLFHVAGSHAVMLMALYNGRAVHLMYKWDVNKALDLIEREQITIFVAVPTMTGDLVRAAMEQGRSLDSLLQVGGGGAPRATEQVRDIDATFSNAAPVSGWGMTETNAIGTGIAGDDYVQRPTSSGRSSQVVELRIVDDEDRDVAPGARGHLLIRGCSMFREYWNRPDANADSFFEGWFRTGDIAYIDDEGFLYIVDRAKDIVIRGGENIGCGEVEDAIFSHPAVKEVVVYGLPETRLGEEVACTIVAKNGAKIDETELCDYLGQHLARYQIPSRIFLVESDLPRIASGKFNKRQIRADIMKSLGLS